MIEEMLKLILVSSFPRNTMSNVTPRNLLNQILSNELPRGPIYISEKSNFLGNNVWESGLVSQGISFLGIENGITVDKIQFWDCSELFGIACDKLLNSGYPLIEIRTEHG